jgi:DNA helicase-2/ATP-dependent DNA helicase PcrA
MISTDEFLKALRVPLHGRHLDSEQSEIVAYPPDRPLIVVAGPGTGKTTAITARALKMVFVDKYDPASIMLTTFTKRAAAELRSRVLGWGYIIRNELTGLTNDNQDLEYLNSLDINRFITGTLDSLAEEILGKYRRPDIPPPVVLDQFVADGILLTSGLFDNGLFRNEDLTAFAEGHGYTRSRQTNSVNVRDLTRLSRIYCDRFRHDVIDVSAFTACGPGQVAVVRVANQYLSGLQIRGPNVMDFAELEHYFLERLRQGELSQFTSQLKAIFVDEFQDTNVLQESIYYNIARCINGCITVVGDDDQSLYRFRGGTVELFRDASPRMQTALGITNEPDIRYLTTNYRAPHLPVVFTQDFAECDADYQPSRVTGKPRVQSDESVGDGLPVLGIFRDNIHDLARSVARLIRDLFNGSGIDISWNGESVHIETGADAQPGDCAFLAHSVREYTREFMGQPGSPRFPLLLRQALLELDTPISSFNPRGQLLSTVPEIAQLCGLMLECIDPHSITTDSISNLPPEARRVFREWRSAATDIIHRNPEPNHPTTLEDFVRSWQIQRSQVTGIQWPSELPLIDLCYHLLTWIPSLQDDPERQIHLEVVARAITETSMLSSNSYRSRIVFSDIQHKQRSVTQAIRNIFSAIALGDIEINEDILETFPRTAINFLTIHQSKGLEFPIVIVDVGAHFRTNHRLQRVFRFPDVISETYLVEDNTIPFGGLSTASFAGWRDRAFDDLIRLYYVAYSRAQSLLVLAGLTSVLPTGRIPHIAMGWTRTGTSTWQNNCPFLRV